MMHEFRRAVGSGCVFLALGSAACRSADNLVPASCLPGAAPAVEAGPKPVDTLGVYLDVSQSVTNFGRGSGESPYRDLIAWLLDLQSEFAEVRSYGFAERIAEIEEDVFVRAARGDAGPCAACGFQESRLDDVLAEIAAPESRAALNVVITDLWIDNSDLIGSARMALQRPVRSILADGRAIGVLGVAASYSGQVYDVPGGRGASTIRAGRVRQRPLFVLLVGPPGQVAELEGRIGGEVFMNGGGAERHFSLFTPVLGVNGPVEQRLAPQGPGVRRAYVLAIDGANVPGFQIDRQAVDPLAGDRPGARPALAVSISGESGNRPAPATYDLIAETWALVPPDPSAACEGDAWSRLDVGAALQLVTDSSGPAIGLDVSHPDLLVIRPGEIAFIRYRAAVGALEQSGPATAWLSDWSFDAADGPALRADPPSFFPALNLAEVGRILEISMDDLVSGEVVAHGSVLLSVE